MSYEDPSDVIDDLIRMTGYQHTFTASKVSAHGDWLFVINPGGGPDGGTPETACLLSPTQAVELARHVLAHTPQTNGEK